MCVCVCEPLVFDRPVGLLAGCEDFFSFEREAPKLFFRRVVFRHKLHHFTQTKRKGGSLSHKTHKTYKTHKT